ncbi:hypothetical protein BKA81DRAFT_410773 [Phyllosticta paracitricarpa]|uniref:Uncharacterized protein n=1 Tax=Phyllosticta paracitricarpa TaxID=2016321 RepID=A0ABR1MVI4_9PEZI
MSRNSDPDQKEQQREPLKQRLLWDLVYETLATEGRAPAALHFDVRIDTAGPFCAAHISVETGPATPPPEQLAVRFPRPAAEWWSDVVGTCNMIRMYRNRKHTEQWTREHAPGAGHIAPATAVWKLAGPWYGDRIHPDFQPHTREHNQKLLNDVGFSGLFWKLP